MIKTEIRTLMCNLTEDELLLRGDEMAKTYIQVAALDMQKKRITAQIKPLDERIEELVTIIDTKTEERRVECQWVYQYDIGIKALIRPDTGEEIETGRIKDHERQQHLELHGAAEEHTPLTDDPELCPKCDGDGQYIEDGIEDGGGEIYCLCPAGVALKEKEETNAGSQEEADQEATETELEADRADAGATGEQVKPLCATCHGNFCGIIGDPVQLTMFECTGYVAPALTPSLCDACHDRSGCDQCCKTCETKCSNEMYCRVDDSREMEEGTVSLCATCKGDCGDLTPGTHVAACTGFCGELNEYQITWRDSVCEEWHECQYADKCYGPANEDGPEAPCACLKEEAAKQQKIETSDTACKICGFDAKSKTYLTRHIRETHDLTIAKYNKHFPPPKPDLDKLREARAERLQEPDKDGITPDRIETLQVELGNGNLRGYRMQIYVSCGDSGVWYNAFHFHTPNGGRSYAPYPKFSEKYPTRSKAIRAACDLAFAEAQKLITDEKLLRLLAVSISDFAIAQNLGE